MRNGKKKGLMGDKSRRVRGIGGWCKQRTLQKNGLTRVPPPRRRVDDAEERERQRFLCIVAVALSAKSRRAGAVQDKGRRQGRAGQGRAGWGETGAR